MILALKKILVRIIASNFVGKSIRTILSNKIPHNSRIIDTSSPNIKNSIIGYLILNAYESAELRFIRKYLLKKYPVIELGSSLGVVTMQIAADTDKAIYAIEANSELIPIIQSNLHVNKIQNVEVFNHLITTRNDHEFWQGADNTAGSISINSKKENTTNISLTAFIAKHNIDEFILVCDIEGGEIFILKEESSALRKCKQIIIELHETIYESERILVTEMEDIILKLGFKLIDRYGFNYVYEIAR